MYIDESGDEGFNFAAEGQPGGSSKWFVLSAIILPRDREPSLVKVVDVAKAKLKKDAAKPLHFVKLNHDQRVYWATEIAKLRPLDVGPLLHVSVLVHKPSLKEPEKFQERFRLYFYGVRFILERVSWCCRDRIFYKTKDATGQVTLQKIPGDGTAEVVFSNRGGMSYTELCDYLKLLKADSHYYDCRIEWKVRRYLQ